MPVPALDPALVARMVKMRAEGRGCSEIARACGVHRVTAYKYLRRHAKDAGRLKKRVPEDEAKPFEKEVTDGRDLDGSVDLVTEGRPATVDEIIASCQVDTKVWVPKTYSPGTWQGFYKRKDGESHQVVRLFRSRVTFERVMPPCIEAAILELVRGIVPPAALPAKVPESSSPKDGFMVSWGIYDAHIGMYAWNEEVGDSYDVKIAERRVMNSIDDMVLELEHYPIKKIILPVGNDFMHFDSVRKKTAFGEHHLDSDSRFAKAYRTALACLIHMVERARQIAQEVEVVYVPGNHDMTTAYTLAVALECFFREVPQVQFDLRACPRKYKQHGGVVICYDHGDGVRPDQYPRIFSQEARDLWATSTYREVQCGHFHQRKERTFEGVVPTNGLLIRVNPALTNCDMWHHKQGLIGEPVKSVEAWRYDKVGYRGSHCVWARDEDRAAR